MILLKLITLTTIISFLWSGLTINLLQLINYLTLRRVKFSLFTRVNYYLMYSAWSQIVALFDWFFGAKFKVYLADKQLEEEIFKDHSIFLANHGFELDWVGAWQVTDKFGQLASCKAMLKSDLKNWEKDKHKFGASMDILLKYEPMVATFFCEGTRFTKDKVAESQKFAQERGLVAPKYHLIPRTKGFVAVMAHIKALRRKDPNLRVWVYNAQIAYDESGAMNIADVVERGLTPSGALYFERFSIDQVPDDEDACGQWLHDLFLAKDKLQEHFNEHGTFPGHLDRRFVAYKPRLATLANWIFWALYTTIPLIYLTSSLYARYGALHVSIVMSTFLMLSYVYLNYIMYQADVGNEKHKLNDKKN